MKTKGYKVDFVRRGCYLDNVSDSIQKYTIFYGNKPSFSKWGFFIECNNDYTAGKVTDKIQPLPAELSISAAP